MPTDPVRLALVIAGLLAILPSPPSAALLAFLVAIAVLLAASIRWDVRIATVIALLGGGVLVRLAEIDRVGSDVLWVTEAAIGRVLAGDNPYGVGYVESSPDGAPFPYGPVALLWYLPLRTTPEVIELGAALVITAILAIRGRLVGLAVFAMSPVLVSTSIDGANDTSLGLLLLLAILAAGRWPAVGATLLAAAVAFKLSALAFVPAFLAWGGLRIALAFVAASLVAWAPVIAGWGIPSFIESARIANDFHRTTTWSLGLFIREITGTRIALLDQLRFALGAAIAVVSIGLRRSLDTVILAGSAVYLVTLYAGNWGTYAYFAGIAPLICWRLDDWLGLPSRSLLPLDLSRIRRTLDRGSARGLRSGR